MKLQRLTLLIVLLVVVGLPLLGKWKRDHAEPRCALDGLALEPLYQVRIVDRTGESQVFCCIHCARLWLERPENVAVRVYVTDEAGGGEFAARAAHVVQSPVVTNPVTGNRIHAFRNREDAEEHARAFGGLVLPYAERPFPNGDDAPAETLVPGS